MTFEIEYHKNNISKFLPLDPILRKRSLITYFNTYKHEDPNIYLDSKIDKDEFIEIMLKIHENIYCLPKNINNRHNKKILTFKGHSKKDLLLNVDYLGPE